MDAAFICPQCRGTLTEGIIMSSDGLFFMPSKQPRARFGLKTTIPIASARACSACGHVELVLHPHELQAAID